MNEHETVDVHLDGRAAALKIVFGVQSEDFGEISGGSLRSVQFDLDVADKNLVFNLVFSVAPRNLDPLDGLLDLDLPDVARDAVSLDSTDPHLPFAGDKVAPGGLGAERGPMGLFERLDSRGNLSLLRLFFFAQSGQPRLFDLFGRRYFDRRSGADFAQPITAAASHGMRRNLFAATLSDLIESSQT